MKRSSDRILTTHVGSLIRPQPLQEFLRAKQQTARFFADHILPQAGAYAAAATKGAESVLAAEEAAF